jgi:hypothetical protein
MDDMILAGIIFARIAPIGVSGTGICKNLQIRVRVALGLPRDAHDAFEAAVSDSLSSPMAYL